jgi:ATP synthase protein I
MFRATVHQALAVSALTLGCMVLQGWETGASALVGGACIVVPNALFALRLSISRGRRPESYPVVFLLGEVFKVMATGLLMAASAKSMPWLVWPAMIGSIVLAANAIWFVPLVMRGLKG